MSNTHTPLTIILAEPRGFCAGVDRAIDICNLALKKYGAPIYVRHEIVHNKWVVEDLKARGVVFVKEVDEVPDGAITIFSAHGVSDQVEADAAARDLPVLDATCPLVTKVHNQARRYERDGHDIILIGHDGHPEVEGTRGRVSKVYLVPDIATAETLSVAHPEKLSYVTQTTLSVDDTKGIIEVLKRRFPSIVGPAVDDICYATQNRQNAVRELCQQVDRLLVVGATNSSNSNRLRDLGEELGVASYLIKDETEIQESWLEGTHSIGVTAGASAPELLVERVVLRLQTLRESTVRTLDGVKEDVHFNVPRELRDVA